MTDSPTLTIREVAAHTGIAAPTLRMWETRYGFPVPKRLPSGHRRYSVADVEDMERRFEYVWTVDPELVRDAARIAGGLATAAAPDLAEPIDTGLDAVPATGGDQLELAAALTTRMVAYVGSGP